MSTCKTCSQELIIELDPEDFDEATSSAAGGQPSSVPDDLFLTCGCHFHWQCLLDESPKIATNGACPSCNQAIASSSGQILSKYHNEGGIQENLDIAALVREEAYLDANPSARPARAFLTMCAEGDVVGIVELLQAISTDSDEGDISPAEILRYQDPLNNMTSGYHIAIANLQQEVVWALLWLASDIPDDVFPDVVTREARALGGGREMTRGVDIRSLMDSEGNVGADLVVGFWTSSLGMELLKVYQAGGV
ncbi:hypothetical protein BJ878DRAFT_516004 [Calycina marina]|uniref:Uncharacterized protein n=1 Tax=Calycina marina TaxID=1763456 RepID=A0A9P8CD91_9HELO|nr:hypothetical protein BJ878DRAFT_516004 [Calycina marina]